MQILLLEPSLEGMRNFVKPPQMTGTPPWNAEMDKLSPFPAGTPRNDAELRSLMQYFQRNLLLLCWIYLLIVLKQSTEQGKWWWERREVQWWSTHVPSGQSSGNRTKNVLMIYKAHLAKSYNGISLQCFQIFVWVGLYLVIKQSLFTTVC